MGSGAQITDTKLKSETAHLKLSGGGEKIIWDGELKGFGVRVTHRSATFFVKYRAGGKQRKFKIGRFGEFNAHLARQEAKSILRRVARGEDPAEEKQAAKVEAIRALTEQRDCNTYFEVAARFIRQYARPRQRTWKETARVLGLRDDGEGNLVHIDGGLADPEPSDPSQRPVPEGFSTDDRK